MESVAFGDESTIFDDPILGYLNQPGITQNLGPGSPYFSLAANGSDEIPSNCTVTFVNVLSRHGARFPTSGKAKNIKTAVEKFQTALQNSSITLPAEYAFLRNYTYTLGLDNLTQFGQQELFNSGLKFARRYGVLLANSSVPFVRASGSPRVVQSSQNFSMGYNSVSANKLSIELDSILVISEDDGSNNTLHTKTCNALENEAPFSTLSDEQAATWTAIYTPNITARLNANIPTASLNNNDTVAMMDLCTFETVATANGAVSPFCTLFTEDEWVSYSFLQSIDKYFADGPGNKFGATNGVGFVNELIARLTNTEVMDQTSTNTTLDSSNVTFPLGLKVYADFSHDTSMTSIFTALGLFNASTAAGGLNSTRRESSNSSGFVDSRITPFAARAYFEKMICPSASEEMIRIVVNDEVQSLSFCGGDGLGMCTLSAFVESQSLARGGGLFAEC